MTILEDSRNSFTSTITQVDQVTGLEKQPTYLDIRERITALSPDDRYFQVAEGHTWGLIGLSFLLDARAWWALADLSNVIDPFTELVPGAILRVPSQDRYMFRILSGENT